MNYAGNFDARLSADGTGLHSNAHVHVDTVSTHAPSDAIIVPDANLLFNGDFKRSGFDLVLSRDDRELVLHDYFKGEKRAPLASPDGAHLTGDIVNTLAGHQQFAQADGSASVAHVIGRVTKLTGTATAVRNGVSILLHQGDNVEKGDVVQSGSGSTLGVTFIDGTVFGLSSNARMVLNEMVYDPNGSNNSSLMTLVAGTISFVAGETAKHGDMKVDTPVATMGIRGTAVLVEIDFDVPGPGIAPPAKFQVLVEPDGTTGSYTLFDKTTLAPIATVNQAGIATIINGQGGVSYSTAPLSPDAQKLVIDLFTLKFTDNSNANPKTTTAADNSITPSNQLQFAKATVLASDVKPPDTTTQNKGSTPPDKGGPIDPSSHVPGPPKTSATGGHTSEMVGVTGDSQDKDFAFGIITFNDINVGDTPSVTETKCIGFTYQDASGKDISTKLNALQLADILAVETKLELHPDAGNKNTGTTAWIYSVADNKLDFLAEGEILTLVYQARVDNNFALNDEYTLQTFTITIIGTNDTPVITSSAPALAFTGDHEVVAGYLSATDSNGKVVPTSGTLVFTDPDLTDTHSVSAKLTGAAWVGGGLKTIPPGPLAAFEAALTAKIGTDSTGSGQGVIDWQLAQLPDYLADFLPKDKSITLTYTITVTDSIGATATQTVTVTITHTTPPDVAWIHPTGGLWETAANWETGTVPTAADDVVIPDEQVIGGTGHYEVTIATDAEAKSVTLNAENTSGAQLLNNSTLKIGGALTLLADGVLINSHTVNVGGQTELLNQSSLQNSGTITLGQGGDFKDQSTVTNTGTIEVAGGTLNVLVDVANSTGLVTIDPNTVLTVNSATITGGTINDYGTLNLAGTAALKNGTLNVTGTLNAQGTNTLDKETVSNTGTGAIDITGTLTLDNTTTISNGAGNAETVETNASLTLQDSTSITGGKVTDKGTLNLQGTAALKSGTLANTGTVNASGTNTLDGESVSNDLAGVIAVTGDLTLDNATHITNVGATNAETVAAGASLTLQDTSSITGGALNNFGTVKIEAASGATLDGVNVQNGSGIIQVDQPVSTTPATLVVDDGTTITGGELTIGPVGTFEVKTALGATLSGVDVDNFGVVQVDTGSTLTLSGTTITGSTVTDNGAIHVTGDSTIESAALKGGQVTVDSGKTLTLDSVTVSGTQFTDKGKIAFADLVMLAGIDAITGIAGSSITNAVTLDITGTTTLTTDSVTNNGNLQVDTTGKLNLDGTTITGGTITDKNLIEVTGDSTINGNASVQGNGVGQVTVDSGKTLTLDNVTVTGTQFTDKGKIAFADLVTLEGTTITGGGNLTNAGTIKIETPQIGTSSVSTLDGVNVVNSGGIIQVDISSGSGPSPATTTLVLDDGTKITGGTLSMGNVGVLEIESATGATLNNVAVTGSGKVQVDGSSVLILQDGTDISGGTLTNLGTIKATSGTATLGTGHTITNTGILEAASGATLKIHDGVTGTGSATIDGGTLEIGIGATDAQTVNFISTGTLQLDDLTSFIGTVNILEGDIIDLANTAVSTAVWNGSTLTVNGAPTAFTVSGVPTGDTFAFKSNGHGGTALAVLAQVETVGSTATSGVEGAPITLHFTDALTAAGTSEGATLTSFVISGIPAGATVADVHGNPLTIFNGTVTLDQAQLAAGILTGLTITPGNDTNFTLSAVAIATDSQGYEYTVPATETVTVAPLTPSVAFTSSAVSGTEGQPIAIALSDSANGIGGATGDGTHNTMQSLVLSGIPDGAVLSDGSASHTITVTGGTLDITGWTVSTLTIRPPNDTNFTLTVTATEKDADNPAQTSTATATETVTVTPLNLVANGGFETGNFSGWILSGNLGFTSVDSSVVHTGSYAASLGPVGSDGFLTQHLSTIPGRSYILDFWLENDSGGTNEFSAHWNGATLLSYANVPGQRYTHYTYTVTATSSKTDLSFEFRQGPAYWHLDDVSVSLAPPIIFNGMTLTVAEGGTTLLTNSDFSVTDPGVTNFTYSVNSVTGGQFEVFNGTNWVSAPTGGFTSAQIAAGQVEFVQDGSTSAPNFSIQVSDGSNASAPIAPTINFTDKNYAWNQLQYPAVMQGVHQFGVNPQFDGRAGIVVLAYASASNYSTSDNSYTATRFVESLNPYFLPGQHAAQTINSSTVQVPARYSFILPNINFSGTVKPEGIFVYKGQVNSDGTGGNALWQVTGTSDSNGGVTTSAPTRIGTAATNFSETQYTIYNLTEGFRNSSSNQLTAVATSYDVAWDQYNSATKQYSLELQIVPINEDGSFGTPKIFSPVITEPPTSATSITVSDTAHLPAWQFRAVSTNGSAYALAIAETDTTSNSLLNVSGPHDAIHFQGYTPAGIPNELSFYIQPDLTAYTQGAATNHIVWQTIPSFSPYPGQTAQALQYVQVSSTNLSKYAVLWNETVSDRSTHDQVEFALSDTSGNIAFRSAFQIADGNAQNIRIGTFADPAISGQDDVVVVYGDDTGTHILEYGVKTTNGVTAVTLLASFTDQTTQAFSNLTVMGDGRITLTYDKLVNASPDQTSQYLFKTFDLRTTGITINDSGLNDGQNKYFAGTHYTDTVTGENNVNNQYYFVGQNLASGPGPVDHFNGGSNGWNIAIFADARSNYNISTQVQSGPNITTIASNGHDPEHTGSLAVTNVEFLAFNPAADPTPHNGIIDVNGGTFVILGGNSPITIEAGATAEIDSAASGSSSYSGSVTFEGAIGTLVLDQPAGFNGPIAGILGSGDVLDIAGFNATQHTIVAATGNGSYNSATNTTTLTVTDSSSHQFAALTLVGDYSGASWKVTSDGHGGADIVTDAPAVTMSAASPAFITLDDPALSATQATGINNAGIIVGQGNLDANHQRGWSYDGVSYTTISAFNAQDTSAHAINNNGVIAGDYSPARSTPRYGFTDTNGSFAQIASDSPYPSTNANGINDDGVVVGNDYLHSGTRYSGYIYDHGTFTYLNAPGTNNSNGDTWASDINNHQDVVGSFNPNASISTGYQGFFYHSGAYTTIADPNGVNGTFANGINDYGQIVGWYNDANGKAHGYIYSGGIFTTIDDPLGVNGTVVTGINNSDQVVGYYLDSSGISHGFETTLNATSTAESTPLVLTSLNVADPAAGANSIQVSLAVGHGTLALNNAAGLSTTFDTNHDTLTITGSTAGIDAALAKGVVYTPAAGFHAADTLTVMVSDEGHNPAGIVETTIQTLNISVTHVIAAGGTFDVNTPSSETVTFAGKTGSLVLDQPDSFHGHVSGFTGTAPDAAHSDKIDLVGIDYNSSGFHQNYDTSTGLLTVTDGINSASFTLDNFNGTLKFDTDGHGGTLISDPPAAKASTSQITGHSDVLLPEASPGAGPLASANAPGPIPFGGPGHDQFVFNASLGTIGPHIVSDFGPGQDHSAQDNNAAPFNSNDPTGIGTWLASHSTPVNGSLTFTDLHADGYHPGLDTLLPKNVVTLAGLHVTDFHFTSG